MNLNRRSYKQDLTAQNELGVLLPWARFDNFIVASTSRITLRSLAILPITIIILNIYIRTSSDVPFDGFDVPFSGSSVN